jgi:hypothetical protein
VLVPKGEVREVYQPRAYTLAKTYLLVRPYISLRLIERFAIRRLAVSYRHASITSANHRIDGHLHPRRRPLHFH